MIMVCTAIKTSERWISQGRGEVRYEMDAQDRIVSVDAEFERFAVENGAPGISASVVGTPLWCHVKGPVVVEIYQRLFSRVRRTGEAARFQFRCDSPSLIRKMNMTVATHGLGGLSVETTAVEMIHRPPVETPEVRADRSSSLLTTCAWCLRVDVGSEWVELEAAHRMATESREFGMKEVTHGICPDCLPNVLKNRRRRQE